MAPLARHRAVYAAMGELMTTDIHALSIRAGTPDESCAVAPGGAALQHPRGLFSRGFAGFGAPGRMVFHLLYLNPWTRLQTDAIPRRSEECREGKEWVS